MSTKGTIFLTKDNEHCYEETIYDETGEIFNVYLEVDPKNLVHISQDIDGVVIGIRASSELASILRRLKDVNS